ncbi:AvrBs1/Avra family type III secretion system effector [Xanthomonas dyei]|nr:AvrBs1/Avra family type III secretion system effector [Xanthomonas dyei]
MKPTSTPAASTASTSSVNELARRSSQSAPERVLRQQDAGPLTGLRNFHRSSTQARSLERLSEGQVNLLNRVHEKKGEVQKVAASYEKLCKGATIDSSLPASEHFLFTKNSDIENRFSAGQPAFVRSLRYTSDEEALTKSSDGGKTLAKREIDTLMNNVPGIDIVATPSTLIGSRFKSSIISRMEKPYRPKWKGLPSVVYLPPAVDESSGQSPLLAKGLRRPGFGDIYTYQTSKAFHLNGYLDRAPSLSHAERFTVIEENSKRFIKPDPLRPREGFSHSAQDLANDLSTRQAAEPSRILTHNEFFAKLEIWDAKAVEIGDAKDVAIATLLEFNIEMALLERSLSSDGANGETLTDHLRRQLAWPADPSETPLGLESVESRLSTLGDSEKQAYLDGVLDQLRERVTLCTYQYNETGSALLTLAFSDFSREDILAGIKRYLGARLPNLSSRWQLDFSFELASGPD